VLLTVPIAAVSLAVRFRRAGGLERQQLRWLAFAAGLASVGAVLVLAGTSLPTSTATTLALITWGAGLCLVLLPLAIGAAILHSRLLTWIRSAAARSPTGCSRCRWLAAMPASPLDSADSWDASPAWWWPPPWLCGALPAGCDRKERPAQPTGRRLTAPQQEVNGVQLRPAPAGRSLPHTTPKE
jgi:hypothetical protein